MKKVLIKFSVVISLLLSLGCNEIPGVLNVQKKLNVLINGKSQVIEAGQYNTDLKVKKSKVTATIETSTEKFKVVFEVPENSQLPENGPFALASAQSGQPFDVQGNVQTVRTRSEDKTGYESCQYQDFQNVCDQTGCHPVPVYQYGNRFVQYYLQTTDQRVHMDMLDMGASPSADFNGHINFTEKIIIYESQCT